jgi:hypothetical protein
VSSRKLLRILDLFQPFRAYEIDLDKATTPRSAPPCTMVWPEALPNSNGIAGDFLHL